MRDTIKKLLRRKLLNQRADNQPVGGRTCFAQEGEDVLLWRILDARRERLGVYVDVGSNHPWKHSNTAFFYMKGWSGIAIDPNPDFAADFVRERPRDIFLNVGINDTAEKLVYYRFPESLYNTFCAERSRRLVAAGTVPPPEEIDIPTMRLADALCSVWPSGKTIDLLSIDAEGMDEKVLSGHDFTSYPTKYVIAETDANSVDASCQEPIIKLLRTHGFCFVSKLWRSVILIHRTAFEELGIEA